MSAHRKFDRRAGRALRTACALGLAALVAGCGSNLSDARQRVSEIKARPGGRIEPLPEVKPYETFSYVVGERRSPFAPTLAADSRPDSGVRPDSLRPREFLEQFSLDTLRMVGTLNKDGRLYGLVQTKDGLVHRVTPGNHVGQADGRVTAIEDGRIALIEIAPDGMGGYIERPAALALAD
jgi:type IV pilus assembly protein PilP